MTRQFLLSAAAAALVLLSSSLSSAAQLQLSIVYDTSYLPDFSPAPYSLNDPQPCCAMPDDVHQFSLYAQLIGATPSPEQSLGGFLADIVLGPGLTPSTLFGSYAPITSPNYDPPPAGPPGVASRPLFSTNVDAGDPDLVRIAVETDRLAAHGLDPGESGPYLLGNFYLNWDISQGPLTSLYAAPAASAPADPWLIWEGTNPVVPPPSDMLRSLSMVLKCVPEPSSATLAAMGFLGLAIRVRRSEPRLHG